MKWVTVKKAAELSGYSEKAIEACAENGFLRYGEMWIRAPDRRVMLNAELLAELCGPLPSHLVCSREMRLRHATPPWADPREIKGIYLEAKRRTRETGVPHSVDHDIPILGEIVCGLHAPANLRVITLTENCAKNNRWMQT